MITVYASDEPTANLGLETEAAILEEIRALKTTVVFITHRKAPLAADRVLVLQNSCLEESKATLV